MALACLHCLSGSLTFWGASTREGGFIRVEHKCNSCEKITVTVRGNIRPREGWQRYELSPEFMQWITDNIEDGKL